MSEPNQPERKVNRREKGEFNGGFKGRKDHEN